MATTDISANQGALLLVESLIHVLIERGVISVEDAVEIADSAAEIAGEQIAGAAAAPSAETVIRMIADSLRTDLIPSASDRN